MTAKRRKITVTVCLTLLLCFAAAVGALFSGAESSAKAEQIAQAYLLHEDRGTRGFWYTGEKGTKDAAQNRIYGKSGLVWLYHYARSDGKQFTDISMINDYTEESQVNYVEYADWVELVTGDVCSIIDAPHGYYNNSQLPIEKVISDAERYPYITKRLLPLDPAEYGIAHTACQFARGENNYTVNVNDDEWHRITLYVGSLYQGENGYLQTYISLYDLNDNLISYNVVDDANKGVWVSYAVKGSVRINLDCGSYLNTTTSVIAFDEYEHDSSAEVTGFSASRTGVKTINLSWQGGGDSAKIYRRIKGESVWNIIARVDGAKTYTDNETDVATEYEYMITSGTARSYTPQDNYYNWKNCEPDAADYNIPQESDAVAIATAPYAATSLEFDKSVYTVESGEELSVTVTAKKFEGGEFVPYEGVDLTLELSGDAAYTVVNGTNYPNMETHLGTKKTDSSGKAVYTYTAVAAGEYMLTASIPSVANPLDPEQGFASCTAEVSYVQNEKVEASAPVLMSISDAIKPGDSVTVTGNFLRPDNEMRIAYAPANGNKTRAFDENDAPEGCKYIESADILVTDSVYNTGLMFIFPENERAGVYDFWVKNSDGWSNNVTLNAARPLYMNQDGGYEGVRVELVGRNLFVSDFGIGDEEVSRQMTKVKLVRCAGLDGTDDGKKEEQVVGIVDGIRYTAENSASGRDIEWSNPYKITFAVPAVQNPGTFEVYVAADGYNYRLLDAPQRLRIYEKKTQSWDTTVFGSDYSSHIGNDPLDLGMYWAQDLNYTNIETMQPNSAPGAALANDNGVRTLTNAVSAAANSLAAQGGGVIYFPEGTYYMSGVQLRENVMIVGAGADKTTLYYVGNGGSSWIRGQSVSNVGVARVSCIKYGESLANPDYIINLSEERRNLDVADRDTCYFVKPFLIGF